VRELTLLVLASPHVPPKLRDSRYTAPRSAAFDVKVFVIQVSRHKHEQPKMSHRQERKSGSVNTHIQKLRTIFLELLCAVPMQRASSTASNPAGNE